MSKNKYKSIEELEKDYPLVVEIIEKEHDELLEELEQDEELEAEDIQEIMKDLNELRDFVGMKPFKYDTEKGEVIEPDEQ